MLKETNSPEANFIKSNVVSLFRSISLDRVDNYARRPNSPEASSLSVTCTEIVVH